MKRTLIAAAVATLATGSALAQSSVTLYGRVNTSAEYQKNIGADGSQKVLQNNASRLGFKGSEDLGGGLKANFFLEHRFNSDTGTATGDFWAGDSWVGLSGGFGSIRAGRLTSAAYYATADYVSLHNHDTGTSSDFLYTYLSGAGKNTISYTTPSLGGFTLEATAAAGEGVATDKVYNLAANYDAGPLHLGAGFERVPETGDRQAAIRALYELGPFIIGGYYQRSDIDGLGKRNAVRVSGQYNLGASEFHLNFGYADDWDDIEDSKAKQATVAYNYNLSKRTKLYAFYTKVWQKNFGYFGIDTGPVVGARDPSSVALGVRHNF